MAVNKEIAGTIMRIKRERTKGWKMPTNAVYVGRPTRYGNPYSLDDYDRTTAIDMYAKWIDEQLEKDPSFLDALLGKDLACWCRMDQPCHADVLIKMIEGKESPR